MSRLIIYISYQNRSSIPFFFFNYTIVYLLTFHWSTRGTCMKCLCFVFSYPPKLTVSIMHNHDFNPILVCHTCLCVCDLCVRDLCVRDLCLLCHFVYHHHTLPCMIIWPTFLMIYMMIQTNQKRHPSHFLSACLCLHSSSSSYLLQPSPSPSRTKLSIYIIDNKQQQQQRTYHSVTMVAASTRAFVARFTDNFNFKILPALMALSYLEITRQKRAKAAAEQQQPPPSQSQ